MDGKTRHFVVTGVYDALFVMRDTETNTLWNHVTGEAVYGPLLGRKLTISNLLQMSVKQALARDPDTTVAISSRPFTGRGHQLGADRDLSGRFVGSIGAEDMRRPRMELGLGIWSDRTHRYYPMPAIRKRGEAFFDVFDNRKVLIYVDPETATPAALFVDAREARMHGTEIVLDDGRAIRSSVFVGRDGQPEAVEYPQQIFTRWYGFALTFPGSEIFGQ